MYNDERTPAPFRKNRAWKGFSSRSLKSIPCVNSIIDPRTNGNDDRSITKYVGYSASSMRQPLFDRFQTLFRLDVSLAVTLPAYLETKERIPFFLVHVEIDILRFERFRVNGSVVLVRRIRFVEQTVPLFLCRRNIRGRRPQNFRNFANFTETLRDTATA